MTPEEELESRANRDVIQPDHPCRNCGHTLDEHTGMWKNGTCCVCFCDKFEPATRDDLREDSDE
jgi:hypothetical protein